MKDYRTLKVWEKSHKLTISIYTVTQKFPKEEMYGLTSQIRRASCSIGANIAEGCGRNGDSELARFLQIAAGSASELDYHLLLAYDLNYIDKQTYEELIKEVIEIRQMLTSFLKRIRSDIKR
jgi:four helix bundle protein